MASVGGDQAPEVIFGEDINTAEALAEALAEAKDEFVEIDFSHMMHVSAFNDAEVPAWMSVCAGLASEMHTSLHDEYQNLDGEKPREIFTKKDDKESGRGLGYAVTPDLVGFALNDQITLYELLNSLHGIGIEDPKLLAYVTILLLQSRIGLPVMTGQFFAKALTGLLGDSLFEGMQTSDSVTEVKYDPATENVYLSVKCKLKNMDATELGFASTLFRINKDCSVDLVRHKAFLHAGTSEAQRIEPEVRRLATILGPEILPVQRVYSEGFVASQHVPGNATPRSRGEAGELPIDSVIADMAAAEKFVAVEDRDHVDGVEGVRNRRLEGLPQKTRISSVRDMAATALVTAASATPMAGEIMRTAARHPVAATAVAGLMAGVGFLRRRRRAATMACSGEASRCMTSSHLPQTPTRSGA